MLQTKALYKGTNFALWRKKGSECAALELLAENDAYLRKNYIAILKQYILN